MSLHVGDTIAMVLRIINNSHVDLHSIHLALVRKTSYAMLAIPACTTFPPSPQLTPVGLESRSDEDCYTPPELTTIHTATIPVARVSNAGSTWAQQLQFRLPSHLRLPTIGQSITPLLKIDYFIRISIPIPQRHTSFVSRLTAGSRKRSHLDFSALDATPLYTTTPAPPIDVQQLQSSSQGSSSTLQFAPIPVVIGTVPLNGHHRRSRVVPSYRDVTDRPAFVRDRFEEEMMEDFSNMESLLARDDDSDDTDSSGHASGEESDDSYHYDSDSKVPSRYRSHQSASRPGILRSMSGLGTPPPSPLQEPTVVMDDDIATCPPFQERTDLEP